MPNNNFSLIIINNYRSLEYLKAFIETKKNLNEIIFLQKGNKKLKEKINLKLNKIKYKKLIKINKSSFDTKIEKLIIDSKEKKFIVSLPSGYFVRNKYLLSTKKLIHFHPGKLPEYAGATSIFYSLLKENKIFCSAIELNEKVDRGNIILTKEFSIPKNKKHLDLIYDNKIRKETLKSLLIKSKYNSKKQKSNKNHYYIAHPIIRKLAINKVY